VVALIDNTGVITIDGETGYMLIVSASGMHTDWTGRPVLSELIGYSKNSLFIIG
jgi:hypothetical protein